MRVVNMAEEKLWDAACNAVPTDPPRQLAGQRHISGEPCRLKLAELQFTHCFILLFWLLLSLLVFLLLLFLR